MLPDRRQALLALALFGLVWGWLSLRPSAPLHEDTSRDLAFARDLVDGAMLHRHGAWASFAALQHGSGWIDFLAVCQIAGLGIVGIERLLTVLLAAAVAVAYLGFSAALPSRAEPRVVERAALVGALVLLASLPFVCEMPILWPPMLLPIVVVLAHVSMWRVVRDGELIDAVALAILGALACDLQLIGVALVLLGLAAVALASKRPLIAIPLAVAIGLATAALCSVEAVSNNVAILRERGWLAPALAAPCLAVIAGALRAKAICEARMGDALASLARCRADDARAAPDRGDDHLVANDRPLPVALRARGRARGRAGEQLGPICPLGSALARSGARAS